jgi:acyl-CoA thioesterase-1
MMAVLGRYGMSRKIYQLLLALALMALPQAVFAAGPQRTIVAFGDSLMAGYQLKPGEGFAPQLEAALKAKGHNVRVIGAGVSGDTTAQGKGRIPWVLAGLKGNPDIVILELGANDMLRGQSPATAKANLDAMIGEFQKAGAKVILAGMRASPNLGAGYQKQFDAIYPALAKSRGVTLYPFFMDGVAAVPGTQLADGMHPNPKGVKIIVAKILPTVEKTLNSLK